MQIPLNNFSFSVLLFQSSGPSNPLFLLDEGLNCSEQPGDFSQGVQTEPFLMGRKTESFGFARTMYFHACVPKFNNP